MVIDAQFCKFTKNYWIVHFKWVHFVMCKFYLNKTIFKKSPALPLSKWVILDKIFSLSKRNFPHLLGEKIVSSSEIYLELDIMYTEWVRMHTKHLTQLSAHHRSSINTNYLSTSLKCVGSDYIEEEEEENLTLLRHIFEAYIILIQPRVS